MAYPSITAPPIYKITLYFKGGGTGWSETAYFKPGNPAVGETDFDTAKRAAFKWATVFAKNMSFKYTVGPARISLLNQRRSGRLVKENYPVAGLLPAVAASTSEVPWTDVYLRAYDATMGVTRTVTLSGIFNTWTDFAADGSIIISPTNIQVANAISQHASFLKATATSTVNANGAWQLRFRVIDPAVNPEYSITDITTDGTFLTYIIRGNPGLPAWQVGDRIAIYGVRQKCVKKANGLANISAVASNQPTAGFMTITTDKRNCCGLLPPITPGPGWKIQLATFAATPIKIVEAGGAGMHKRGRPFGLRAGRRSGVCC